MVMRVATGVGGGCGGCGGAVGVDVVGLSLPHVAVSTISVPSASTVNVFSRNRDTVRSSTFIEGSRRVRETTASDER